MHRARMLRYDDCLRASVASLLHLPAVEVPHYHVRAMGGYDQLRRLNKWLRPRGWSLVEIAWEKKRFSPVAAPYLSIATIEWGSSGDHHCVVVEVKGNTFKVVWDPCGYSDFSPRNGDRVVTMLILTRAIPPRP